MCVFSLSPYNAGTFTVSSKCHINAASVTNRPEPNSLHKSLAFKDDTIVKSESSSWHPLPWVFPRELDVNHKLHEAIIAKIAPVFCLAVVGVSDGSLIENRINKYIHNIPRLTDSASAARTVPQKRSSSTVLV